MVGQVRDGKETRTVVWSRIRWKMGRKTKKKGVFKRVLWPYSAFAKSWIFEGMVRPEEERAPRIEGPIAESIGQS